MFLCFCVRHHHHNWLQDEFALVAFSSNISIYIWTSLWIVFPPICKCISKVDHHHQCSDADNTTTYCRLNLQGYLSAAKVHARQFPPQFPPAPSSAPNELISTDFWIWFPSVYESYFHQFAFQIFDPLCTRMSWGRELWDRWDFASYFLQTTQSRMKIVHLQICRGKKTKQ